MNPHALKSALPRTWGAFFGRHGNFTPAQLAAIPPLLAGENVLLCAPTASGKTEAALAPLIERHLPSAPSAPPQLTLLYLLPTRALISDVWARLRVPLETLRVHAAVKTHDFATFDPQRPASLLLTTPESLDALLASQAKLLANVRALVVDELHTFDDTVRGDQLRVLLGRLRQVRAHAYKVGDAEVEGMQCVGLSATLAQPEEAAERLFGKAKVVRVEGKRSIHAELVPLPEESPQALLDFLTTFRSRGWRKALAFCNSRAEVESYAAAVRAHGHGRGSPFGEAVFAHYSNLAWERRREIEHGFAEAQAALCFASSTLELGIDIGNIDVTLLIGAPGGRAAFVQRIGRANRRKKEAQVVCFYRTPLERTIFGALLSETIDDVEEGRKQRAESSNFATQYAIRNTFHTSHFRSSVAIQQIFSLLKQSPTGALRLTPLAELFTGMLASADLQAILGKLEALGYLESGRPGEWRAGKRLNRLADLQATEHAPLSLHSNLDTGGMAQIKILDQHTQRLIASVDRQWLERNPSGDSGQALLTLEGRALNVEWYDGDALWVSAYRGEETAARLRYVSERQMLSYELARQLSRQVGLPLGSAALVPHSGGWLLFHWLGDVYGRAMLELIGYTLPVEDTAQGGLCLWLPEKPTALPTWTHGQVRRYLHDRYRRYERTLALGAYHHLLPIELRRRAVEEQLDISRFLEAIGSLRIEHVPEALTEELQSLV